MISIASFDSLVYISGKEGTIVVSRTMWRVRGFRRAVIQIVQGR
jgi:hypothetical protein